MTRKHGTQVYHWVYLALESQVPTTIVSLESWAEWISVSNVVSTQVIHATSWVNVQTNWATSQGKQWTCNFSIRIQIQSSSQWKLLCAKERTAVKFLWQISEWMKLRRSSLALQFSSNSHSTLCLWEMKRAQQCLTLRSQRRKVHFQIQLQAPTSTIKK